MDFIYIKVEEGKVVEKVNNPPVPFEEVGHLKIDSNPLNYGYVCISKYSSIASININ